MDKNEVWHAGEDLAAAHLTGLGWRILQRNWRCPAGELDIIAVEPGRSPVVVICEVKTRTSTAFGLPVEAITASKVSKLRELALYWLREQDRAVGAVRFDAIGVLLSGGDAGRIDHRRGIC
ncbi:MAG: YraN family protein [Propionicimonas sp.]